MASKKGKAIRLAEDEMSGRVYDWTGKGNTDSASVPSRRLFEKGPNSAKKARATSWNAAKSKSK